MGSISLSTTRRGYRDAVIAFWLLFTFNKLFASLSIGKSHSISHFKRGREVQCGPGNKGTQNYHLHDPALNARPDPVESQNDAYTAYKGMTRDEELQWLA